MISCKLKLIEKCSQKSIFGIVISWVESNSWEWELINTPGLYGGAHILHIETINSIVQEVGDCHHCCCHNNSPYQSCAQFLSFADISKPMDRSSLQIFIYFPLPKGRLRGKGKFKNINILHLNQIENFNGKIEFFF